MSGSAGDGSGGRDAAAGRTAIETGDAGEGGTNGEEGGAGGAGSGDDAGSGGMAGDSSVELGLEITPPSLTSGKTYVPFTGKISANGAAQYSWSIASGTLPAGLTLQGAQSASVTIAGTPSEAGQFPITLSVTDGSTTKTVYLTLVVTHSALILSDRNASGVNELFLTEIGDATPTAPVRLSASLPTGGTVSNYAWSPDGSKVMYVATQSSGGAAELWVASVASPGAAQRVSAQGVSVTQVGWLGAGNIAAYATTSADAYLVDLSGATPGTSKLAITGSSVTNIAGAGISGFVSSPNGTSIAILYYVPMLGEVYAYVYASWTAGTVTSDKWSQGASDFTGFSFDGRFVALTNSGIGQWMDTSHASPAINELGPSFSGAWSPNSNSLLYYGDFVSSDDPARLKLGTFNGGTLTSTQLVPPSACKSVFVKPWAPNGKNGLFTCGRDLRGIANVASASAGTDFSLLPNGFLPNAFTDLWDTSWSPDSTWVGMSTDRDVDKQNDLYLIRWSAPGATYKAHANSIGSGVATYAFAPNSQSVAFVGTISPQTNSALYLTKLPASGAPAFGTLISSPANAIVQNDINWLPGSRVLTYRASISNATQLFAVPIAPDGTAGTPISISGISGTGVTSYQLAPTQH